MAIEKLSNTDTDKAIEGTEEGIAIETIKEKINEIRTAVLWKKKDSTFEPDFCAQRLDSNPWIVQPFEIYEEIRIEEIKKKHQK